MTFAPRCSPDGNQVVMSLARNGVTDIYRMDLRTRQVTQLTNSPSIDTSPSFSPDGTQITFHSDSRGTHTHDVMAANGSGVYRIRYGPARYRTTGWWHGARRTAGGAR